MKKRIAILSLIAIFASSTALTAQTTEKKAKAKTEKKADACCKDKKADTKDASACCKDKAAKAETKACCSKDKKS